MITDFIKIAKDDVLDYFLLSIGSICFSLFFVLAKYIFNIYYMSLFKFSFLAGIVTIIFTIFGFMIYSFIEYHDFGYFNECFDFSEVEDKTKTILLFLLNFLFLVILQVLALFSLIYFSPTLLMVTEIINPLIYMIIYHFANEYIPHLELIIIGYIIALLSSLIYNEIIILNFCGLSKNTKKFVGERMEKEKQELNEIEYDDNYSDGGNEIENL